jgi:hypothetical protein
VPTRDHITIDLNGMKLDRLVVMDVMGRKVLETNQMELDLKDWRPGTYFLQCILSNGDRVARKIIKS